MRYVSKLIVILTLATTPAGCDRPGLPGGQEKPGASTGDLPVVEAEQPDAWREELDLPQALDKAGRENKTVMLALFSKGASECTLAEVNTLSKPRVVAFLKQHCVAIRVYLDDVPALANRYNVPFVPTMLFLRPDGSEIDRLMGVIPVERFLELASEYVQGRSRLDTACLKTARAAMELVNTMLEKGKDEEAIEELRHVWRLCSECPLAAQELATALVSLMQNLGQQDEETARSLHGLYDESRRRLESNPQGLGDVWLVAAWEAAREESDKTLALYDRQRDKLTTPEQLAAWTEAVLPGLLNAGRYEEIASGMDLAKAADRWLDLAEKQVPSRDVFPNDAVYSTAVFQYRRNVVNSVVPYYQAMIGAGLHDEAQALASRLCDFAPGPHTLNGLAWAGYLTGRPTKANLEQALGADNLSGGMDPSITDTVVRLMAKLGHRQQALEILRERIEKTNYPARAMLEETLAELEKED